MKAAVVALLTAWGLFMASPHCLAESRSWKKLDRGLYLGEFGRSRKTYCPGKPILILRVDPRYYDLRLLCASEHGQKMRDASRWSKEFHLLAVMNASMYRNENPLISTGFMKNYTHINNGRFNPAFGAFMLFNPMAPHLPRVQIMDRYSRNDWKELVGKYQCAVQNYRMISRGKKAGWPQQRKLYRSAAIGMDQDGNVLFILARCPSSTHDLICDLLTLPLHLRDAMYVEGGPQATLFLGLDPRSKGKGMTPSGPLAGTKNQGSAGLIPNVIGISKRP